MCLGSYGSRSGSSYGSTKRRHFGHGSSGSGKHRRNWSEFPLTGSANGDLTARLVMQREVEDRLFIRR